MAENAKIHVTFNKKLIMIGFGSIGKAVLPLMFRHIAIKPEQMVIINKDEETKAIADQYGIQYVASPLTRENYQAIVDQYVSEGDFLLNLSVDVSSLDLIKACQAKKAIYLDSCIEPWAGGYTDTNVSIADRSNYAMREAVLNYRQTLNQPNGPTAVLTHGANPGLVSHFVKQALMNLAKDNHLDVKEPTTREEWAALSQRLGIKVVHVAEHDTQVMKEPKKPNEFINTWSAAGFIGEGAQPAELGWGTHERHFPHDGEQHASGSQCAIYLNRPGASTRVRTWTPLAGAFHGFLITHSEAMSIADYYTVMNGTNAVYRPTVHYAYHPCKDAVLSVHELAGREWKEQATLRVAFDEVLDGLDELGVLLMGNQKGAYWFGSQITVHEARELAPFNNATTMQVSSGVLGGIIWAMQNPNRGIVEPDEMDYKAVLDVVRPYMGEFGGHYTDWTPLKERANLFPEAMDHSDPWQFINIRVN